MNAQDINLAKSGQQLESHIARKSAWPKPQAFCVTLEPEPYPLDALPDTIRAAVEEVVGFVKAPIPLVASSALSALSLACQAHIDVRSGRKGCKGRLVCFADHCRLGRTQIGV